MLINFSEFNKVKKVNLTFNIFRNIFVSEMLLTQYTSFIKFASIPSNQTKSASIHFLLFYYFIVVFIIS